MSSPTPATQPGHASARAHANIALVKYWGKRDEALNLPAVPSLSASLADLYTETTVAFDGRLPTDALAIDGEAASAGELERVTRFLDLLAPAGQRRPRARVESRNTFPRSAGLASSASAFAALAVAGDAALGTAYGPARLSALARRGSGSAARSLYGGYVALEVDDGEDDRAVPIAPAEHFPLDVAVVMATEAPKSVGSREAMRRSARTSPYYPAWVQGAHEAFESARSALLARDFERLAQVAQRNCLCMHALPLTSEPPILYWHPVTVAAMAAVSRLQEAGQRAFYTLDAGANVVVFFDSAHRDAVMRALRRLDAALLTTQVGGGPMLLSSGDRP